MSKAESRGTAKEPLMRESLRLFASRGVDAVSLRDIAAATGFTNPALFRHFAGKEALAEALFEQCYRHLVGALSVAAEQDGLRDWLAGALREIVRLPEGVLFVLDNLKRYWHTLPDDLKARNLPKLAIAMINHGRGKGRIRADIAPELIATVLFGTLGQVARSIHFKETAIDPDTYAARLAELLESGLLPRQPAIDGDRSCQS